jgi:serine/threonine protein kinase
MEVFESEAASTSVTSDTSFGQASSQWNVSEDDVTLQRKVGEGSHAVVWQGQLRGQQGAGEVAIKILKASWASDNVTCMDVDREFSRECIALKSLRHPNLLRSVQFAMWCSGGHALPLRTDMFCKDAPDACVLTLLTEPF